MKRAVPLLFVGTLLLSACASSRAAGGSSAVDFWPGRHAANVPPLAVQRERRASLAAARLLRRVPVPAGSVRLWHEPSGDANDLEHPGIGVSTVEMTADRYGFWQLPGSGASLLTFERRHMLPGLRGIGGRASAGQVWTTEFDSPSLGGSSRREIALTVVPLSGRTILRIDVGIAWIYPRSPREVVPAATREIDIDGAGVAERVTASPKVTRIVRWFDSLNVAQPGPSVGCMAILSLNVNVVFRSVTGKQLAAAFVRSDGADNCSPIDFSIGGKRQTPLIDSRFGKRTFVKRLQQLLGVRFRVPKP